MIFVELRKNYLYREIGVKIFSDLTKSDSEYFSVLKNQKSAYDSLRLDKVQLAVNFKYHVPTLIFVGQKKILTII